MTDIGLQVLGWGGSALLVVSLLQSRMLALRTLNLIAAILLIGYNAALAVWPSVAMNAAVAAINVVFLVAWRTRSDPASKTAGPNASDDVSGAR